MSKENKKKNIKIIIISTVVIFMVITLFLIHYFRKTEWVMDRGAEGTLSKETYLDAGTGEWEYDDDMRIYYRYNILSGSVCFQLTDENGDVVYNMVIDESCEGYIYMSDIGSGVFYDHEFALSEDTQATSYTEIQRKRSNWEKFIKQIKWSMPHIRR